MRLSCLLSAIALALVGCAEPFSADHFRGVQGCWLTSRTCEVFVSGKPYPRVVAFRVKGRSSPFRVSTSDQFYGMRTWFIEPAATEDLSLLPSTQPAVVDRKDALSATITAEPEPKSGLQVFIEVTLDADKPTLTVRHGLKNLQAAKRRLSVWAICAVEHNGMAVVPWKAGKEIKNCVLYPESDPSELCLKFGRQAMGVDYRIPSVKGNYKVGTNSDASWLAFCWGSQAVRSVVQYEPKGEYPDGGCPVTFYNCGRFRDQGFCEFEHVAPLCDLAPGQTAWLTQTLTLLEIPYTSEQADINLASVLAAKHSQAK